jgi:UDP-N-acetylglucosamine/UDP-N-acetylgalactosamine diphosphorylase
MERLVRIRKLLKEHGQEHLLMKYDELDQEARTRLLDAIESIDFELMEKLYQKATEPVIEEQIVIEPIGHLDKDGMPKSECKMYEELGEATIRRGKLAVVTMAGGQGTRLGYNGPKGAFVFDPESGKSIFEALTDTMKDACERYNVDIPWYIMTSRENNEATKEFFEQHHYFGYPGKIRFFIQGELPMLSLDGKILLDKDFQIKSAANGHGGTLLSMEKSGVIRDMKANGIEWVSINGVDNVLVQPVDPLFIGLAVTSKSKGAIKSIAKASPEERVGVICRKNGRVGVVEYTEISNQMANLRDRDGNLVYGDAYALFNLYSIEGLDMISNVPLPYHVAVKKADYIDANGGFVKASQPNAYKFEQFIFDSYELFSKVCVLRVRREDEFAPIKNATGQDSPETALELYRKYMSKNK